MVQNHMSNCYFIILYMIVTVAMTLKCNCALIAAGFLVGNPGTTRVKIPIPIQFILIIPQYIMSPTENSIQ